MAKKTNEKNKTKRIFDKDYFPKSVVAEMFEVSTQCLGRWIRDGIISATKIGREWYLEKKDIEDYLQERKKFGTARV